jgi:redox-sensitive bicupin YhaK (pirin superfamily)
VSAPAAAALGVRRAAERGCFDHGWLKTSHTFSFAEYSDPKWEEYGPLRVINDDWVAAGEGFPRHGHRDMEIITYILAGELEHQDSMGNGSIIGVGDVQRMTAGTGVLHSEFNPSQTEPVRLLQIWIKPQAERLPPGYEQKHFSAADKRGRLRLIAARDGADGAVTVHQDVRVYAGLFDGAERAEYHLAAGRRTWIQMARGTLTINGTALRDGDGAYTQGAARLTLEHGAEAEVLLFDLP